MVALRSPVLGMRLCRNARAHLLASPGILCVTVLALGAPADTQAAGTSPVSDDRAISVGCWDVVAVE